MTTTITRGQVHATRDQIADLIDALFAVTEHPEKHHGVLQKVLDRARYAGPEVTFEVDPDDAEQYDDPSEAPASARCPHPGCGGTEFYEVDRSERWNEMEFSGDADEPAFSISQGDSDYQTIGFKCQSCDRGVTIPANAESDWY